MQSHGHGPNQIYLTHQEHMLNCAVAFANLSIFSKNVEPQAILQGN
jgi:hypothetical protein